MCQLEYLFFPFNMQVGIFCASIMASKKRALGPADAQGQRVASTMCKACKPEANVTLSLRELTAPLNETPEFTI